MTRKSSLEERILGVLMGLGLGVFVGFFLRDRERPAADLSTPLP